MAPRLDPVSGSPAGRCPVGPLPEQLLAVTPADGELVPAWLSDRDRPWIRDLLGSAESFAGRPIEELVDAFCRGDRDPRAGVRFGMVAHALLAMLRQLTVAPPMREVRARLFRMVASGVPRADALAAVASELGVSTDALAGGLFEDLPDRRRVRWPDPAPDPSTLAASANLALARGLLLRADHAAIEFRGAARAILRTAWLLGDGLEVDRAVTDRALVTWRRRRSPHRSARALAALASVLPWAQRYELRAECAVRGRRGVVVFATGDPILPGPEPRLYDSALEARFAKRFTALQSDWILLREPVPVVTGRGLGFPDFELSRRDRPDRWLLEIAGLRDEAALAAKMSLLSAHPRLLLCLPRRRVPESLRDHPRVVPFDRSVDAERVLALIERP